jgi:hypothetical protein
MVVGIRTGGEPVGDLAKLTQEEWDAIDDLVTIADVPACNEDAMVAWGDTPRDRAIRAARAMLERRKPKPPEPELSAQDVKPLVDAFLGCPSPENHLVLWKALSEYGSYMHYASPGAGKVCFKALPCEVGGVTRHVIQLQTMGMIVPRGRREMQCQPAPAKPAPVAEGGLQAEIPQGEAVGFEIRSNYGPPHGNGCMCPAEWSPNRSIGDSQRSSIESPGTEATWHSSELVLTPELQRIQSLIPKGYKMLVISDDPAHQPNMFWLSPAPE